MSGPKPSEDGAALRIGLGLALLALVFGCAGLDAQKRLDDLWGLHLKRSGGGQLSLSEYRGQVLMLDLFTTWSQPSLVSIPQYALLEKRYSDQGLALVGIALDELGDEVVGPFLSGLQVSYPVAIADDDLRQGRSPLGELNTIPTLLIFDRQGRLAKVFYGLVPIEAVEAVVRHLL